MSVNSLAEILQPARWLTRKVVIDYALKNARCRAGETVQQR